MAFRPTAAALSKASRLPLTSKQANKDFYKGPGALPGFGQRSQGRFPNRGKGPYVKQLYKARYFVAPEGWLEDGQLKAIHTSPLKPYVFKRRPSKDTPKVPQDWPIAATGKREEDYSNPRAKIYNKRGFDGEYYLQLAELLRGQTPA